MVPGRTIPDNLTGLPQLRTQLSDGIGFELPDPLARKAKQLTDFLQRLDRLVVESKSHRQDHAEPRIELLDGAEERPQLLGLEQLVDPVAAQEIEVFPIGVDVARG